MKHFSLVSLLGARIDDVPVHRQADVVVVGGGSAGCAAAIAARRSGASVVLIEKSGRLGGVGTAVLDTFYGFYTPGANQKVAGGIGDEIVDALLRQNAAFLRPNTYGAGSGVTYNPEVLLTVWDTFVAGSGVEILFHSLVIDVEMESEGRVRSALVANKNGISRISAPIFVDASGDADLSAFAGAAFDGAETGEKVQALTTSFRLANVDTETARSFPKEELFAAMAEAAASGAYDLPRQEGSIHRTPVDGVSIANMTRVEGVDPTDVAALSRAEIEGRRQVGEYARFLRDRVPGYRRSGLVGISMRIGVRESRRIRGDYQLTAADVLSARRFGDVIARCGAPIEDHSGGTDTVWKYIPDSGAYDIPYRVLLPTGLENVAVAGRCLSATHEAHASCRSIAQCLAMGQAAGTAAALAAARAEGYRDISVRRLQDGLIDAGAILGDPTDELARPSAQPS